MFIPHTLQLTSLKIDQRLVYFESFVNKAEYFDIKTSQRMRISNKSENNFSNKITIVRQIEKIMSIITKCIH